jgi:uncharacterized protein (TIGR02145 family)
MTATKAKYIYGALQLNVSMSDSDATALASVAPMISVNSGTPVAMTGSAGSFTANLEVADTYEITFNSLVEDGYLAPAPITGTFGGGVETKTATYQTDIYTVYVTSNQSPDATIAAKKVSVSYTGLTTAKEVGNNGTVKVPAGLTPTATATDETGYAKTVTVLTASRLITAAYETTIISINMAGENAGVEGDAPQGAQATVSYQGGADQVLTDNTQTAKVPTGTDFTITYAAVTGYATPATYNATATGASMTAPKATYVYGALQLTVSMSDSDASALADVRPMIAINGGAAAAMIGSAGVFTASMEVGDTYEITFNSLVADGYQTPAAISGTFQGGVQTETAQYLTTILTMVSIVVTKDGNVQSQSLQGAGVTVAYTGQTSPATLSAINDSVKVPANLTPIITPLAVQYYSASATLTDGSISVTYATVSRTVSITSNQASDAVIAAVAATLTYTYEGETVTRTDISDGTEVLIPATATGIAFTAPDVTGYAKSISGAAISYATTFVSVNMVGETSGVEGAAPQGAQATVSYQGGADQVLTDNTQTAKVPMGTDFTITYANVSGYATPATYSATATGASMTAPKATYVYGVLQLTVSMSDSDATALAGVQPMIAINGGTAAAMTGSAGVFTANMEVGDTYEITFNSLVADGYQTPAAISGTFQGGVQTETAQYLTTILTLGSIVTTKDGNVQGQNPQGAGVTVAYTGQTAPATLTAINDSVKVPANLTPTITPLAVQYYAASATLTGGSISVTYATVSRTVSITSNQASDSVIAVVAATLTYTYEGETVTRTDIADGTEVLIPATATAIAFTAPDVTGYAKSISGAAISYATTILTVTLTSDTGEADLSGVTKTVTDTTDSTIVTPQQDGTYKIPTGHGYSVSVSDDVEGYKAPDAATGTAAGTTATVTMTYEEQAGFVDLGLPSGLKWAQGNLVKDSQGNYSIGAETDWGTYVSWGNIIGHNEGEGYDFSDANYNSTPGHSVAANIPSNDAAHDIALATLGSPWHLPTKEDFQELYDNTDSEWVADYNGTGVAGRKFMKKSDHSVYVFFPASGGYNGTSLNGRGTNGYYWSSSFYSTTYAYDLNFNSSSVNPQNDNGRRFGFTVRPVQ